MPDHRVLGNRSRAFLAMEQLDRALRDAEACCRLRLHWAKVSSSDIFFLPTYAHLDHNHTAKWKYVGDAGAMNNSLGSIAITSC